MVACEICGYQGDTQVVQECADGILRCHVCREKAMYGKYTPAREAIHETKPPTLTETWKRYLELLEERS